ncbi:MAG: hypothetical protein AB7O66_12230 [Limisphaerales bacterium]
MMLRPLSRGEHAVYYRIVADFLPDGRQKVTLHLTVEWNAALG